MKSDKCCVCNIENKDRQILESTSSLTYEKRCYCSSCLFSGYEPYEDLVDFGWDFKWFNNQYQQRVLAPTLQFYNKSIANFNEDVKKRRDEKDDQL